MLRLIIFQHFLDARRDGDEFAAVLVSGLVDGRTADDAYIGDDLRQLLGQLDIGDEVVAGREDALGDKADSLCGDVGHFNG